MEKRYTNTHMSTPFDYPTLIPYFIVKGAAQAIEFYKIAFGAEERYRLSAEGSIGHAELTIRGQVFMLSDEMPGMSTSPATFVLMVGDTDEAFARAVAAGGTALMPPMDMFYGFRMGVLNDPFGHKWMLQHKVRDVSPEEMQKRWEAMAGKCSQS